MGKIQPGTTPDVIFYNLKQLITNNIELIGPLNQALYFADSPINRQVIEQIIPKVYNSHFVFIKIIDHIETMNSPVEYTFPIVIITFIVIILLLVIIIILLKKKKKK